MANRECLIIEAAIWISTELLGYSRLNHDSHYFLLSVKILVIHANTPRGFGTWRGVRTWFDPHETSILDSLVPTSVA